MPYKQAYSNPKQAYPVQRAAACNQDPLALVKARNCGWVQIIGGAATAVAILWWVVPWEDWV